jgi:hypothetical protein
MRSAYRPLGAALLLPASLAGLAFGRPAFMALAAAAAALCAAALAAAAVPGLYKSA